MAVPDDARPTVPFVTLQYVRAFPHPVGSTYAWLTDYQDDDHEKAGAIIKRRTVAKRDGNVVVLDGELETFGIRMRGLAEVRLHPEDRRWVASLGHGKSVYEYRLFPTADGGSRLEVAYRIGARKWTRRAQIWLAKPRIRAEIDRMWAGFADAMAKDLRAG